MGRAPPSSLQIRQSEEKQIGEASASLLLFSLPIVILLGLQVLLVLLPKLAPRISCTRDPDCCTSSRSLLLLLSLPGERALDCSISTEGKRSRE